MKSDRLLYYSSGGTRKEQRRSFTEPADAGLCSCCTWKHHLKYSRFMALQAGDWGQLWGYKKVKKVDSSPERKVQTGCNCHLHEAANRTNKSFVNFLSSSLFLLFHYVRNSCYCHHMTWLVKMKLFLNLPPHYSPFCIRLYTWCLLCISFGNVPNGEL